MKERGKGGARLWWMEWDWPDSKMPSLTVSDAPQETGLLDANGYPLVKQSAPVGFIPPKEPR